MRWEIKAWAGEELVLETQLLTASAGQAFQLGGMIVDARGLEADRMTVDRVGD